MIARKGSRSRVVTEELRMETNYTNRVRFSGPSLEARHGREPGEHPSFNLQLAAGTHYKKAPRPWKGRGAGWAG